MWRSQLAHSGSMFMRVEELSDMKVASGYALQVPHSSVVLDVSKKSYTHQ